MTKRFYKKKISTNNLYYKLKYSLSSGNQYLPFTSRRELNPKIQSQAQTERSKSRRKLINPNKSNLGPNGQIVFKKLEDFKPGRKLVPTKRKEDSGLLKWKVNEVRLTDNRPLSMKSVSYTHLTLPTTPYV